MAVQLPGVARIHTGGGTELVLDIAKSPDEPTYTSTFTPAFRDHRSKCQGFGNLPETSSDLPNFTVLKWNENMKGS